MCKEDKLINIYVFNFYVLNMKIIVLGLVI